MDDTGTPQELPGQSVPAGAGSFFTRIGRAFHKFIENQKNYWKRFSPRPENITRAGSAVLYFFLAIALGLIVIGWLAALYSIIATGLVFGYALLPSGGRIVIGLFVSCLFLLIFLPLHNIAEGVEARAKGMIYRSRLLEKIGRVFVWLVALFIIVSVLYRYDAGVHAVFNVFFPPSTTPQQ